MTAAKEPDRAEGSRNWVLVAVVTAVISTIVATLGTVGYNALTRRETRLEYKVVRTPPFFGRLATTAVYTIQVSNAGDGTVKVVRLGVDFPGGRPLPTSRRSFHLPSNARNKSGSTKVAICSLYRR